MTDENEQEDPHPQSLQPEDRMTDGAGATLPIPPPVPPVPPLPPRPPAPPLSHDAPAPGVGGAPAFAGTPAVSPVPPPPPGGFVGAPTPAPGAPAPSRAAWFTGRGILNSAIAGAIGVGFSLVASVLVLLLSILGFMVGGGIQDTQAFGLDVDTSGLGFFSGVIFLAALGLFGQLGITVDIGMMPGGSSGASGTLFVVPVLVLIAGVIGTAWWSYRSEHGQRTTARAGVWVWGAASGLVASVLLLLLSFVGRSTTSTGVLGSSFDVTVWTFTLGTLFGPILVVGLAAVFGRWLARGSQRYRHFGAALWCAPSRFRWGTRDVWDYIVVLAIVFAITSLIVAIVQGDGALGALPSLLGQAMIAAASIAHFGAISASATAPETTTTFVSYFTSGVPSVIWLLLIAVVISTMSAAMLIGRRRQLMGQPPLRDIWRLPVLTTAVAVVWGVTLGSIYAAGGMNLGFTGDVSFGAALVPAIWTYLLVLVWAGVVEILARFVTPSLVAALPLAARLKVAGDAPAAAFAAAPVPGWDTTGAQPTLPYPAGGFPVGPGAASPVYPGGVPAAYPAAAPQAHPVPAQPLSPKTKKRIIVWSIVGGALILIALVATIVVTTLQNTVYSPSATAQRYVDAVADGRFAEAQALESGSSDSDGALLSSDSVELLAGMEDIEVREGFSSGSRQLLVTYTLDGASASETITMRSSGKQFLFFDTWEVSAGLAADAQVWARDLDTISVGGVELEVGDDGIAAFAAYPGSYEVAAPSSQWMQAVAEPLVVHYGFGSSDVQVEPTPALATEVERQVREVLDSCASSTKLDDADCPFDAWAFREVRNVAWTVDSYPEIELSADGSWFDSTDTGTATATWEEKDYSGEWEAKTYSDRFYLWGEVDVDGDTVAVSLD